MTSEAAELARERIQEFGDEHPEALRLARYASLAVRVDAALLRALRTELLPGSDAGIEADLWFSELTESVSSQGFVLDGDVAAQLREELAAERVNNEQRALAAAARITRESHRHWPESLRLEERATALALRTPPAAGVPIPPEEDLETLLRGLLKAMTESPSRGTEVSRWAQRALPRLPKAARETEAALLLALGAAERLGTSIRFADDDRPGRLPDAAGWVLPAASFSRFTSIGLRRFDTGLEFVEPAAASSHLSLPETTPLFLEISWSVGAHRHEQTISVWPGRTVPVPAAARDISFRSLAGEEFEFEKVEGETEDVRDEAARAIDDVIERTTVLVTFEGQSRDATPSCGFFVAPDTLLAFALDPKAGVGASCTVITHDQRVTGRVTARQHALASVLIRIFEPLANPGLLSRRFHSPDAVRPFAGSRWRSWSYAPFRAPMEGVVIPPEEGASGELMLLEPRSPGLPLRGAPVVIDGQIAGQVVEATPSAIRARPMELLDRFINAHPRQSEDQAQPVIFVSYAPQDEYGKGLEMDDPQVDRVTDALRAARLNPVIDTTISGRDDLIRSMNASDGAVVLMTPVAHRQPGTARLEMLAIAYRLWAEPNYPVALFRFRQPGVPSTAPALLVGFLSAVEAGDLDHASDDELRDHAHRRFGHLGLAPSEDAALSAIQDRLAALARKTGMTGSDTPMAADTAVTLAKAVMEHGIEAELASERWLSKLAPSDARGLTDLAAMFSFPASVSEPLRQVANGRSNVRAFSLNAMPLQVARAVIRRAWLGRRLPPSLVFRDQSPPSPDAIRERLVQEVSKQLPCSPDEAGFLVERVSASALIILMLRPLPDPSYIEHLLKSLPGTLFLFLIGSEGENPYPKIVTELTIPAGADMEFFKRYKHVMQTSVPREADRPEASTPPTETSEKVPAVVICAASASAAMVTRIERALTAAGLPVWIDKSELSAGALWRRELNDAIRASRAMVLVWSQAAARSRWVSLEILTAFHLDRFIVPCIIDATPLPEFLQQTVHLDLRGNGDEGIQRLIRAATEAPARRNTPSPPAVQDADVTQAATRLIRLQNEILDLVAERDPAAAAVAQRRLDPEMAAAERRWPSALMIRMLAGYHRKNAYALKHWKAIEAGQTPNDKLLLDAERCFLDAALVDPQEVSVLSGLASILSFERELDAAAFFNERALEVSKLQPNVSSDAEQNRRLIERMRRQGVPRAPETQRSTQRPSVAQTSEAAPVPMRPSRTIKTVAKGSRKIAPKKK